MFQFYISPDTEKQKLMDMFCVPPVGVSLAYRAKQYGFPITLAEKMYALPRYQWDTELENMIAETYRQNTAGLNQSLQFFQTFWQQHATVYKRPLTDFFQKEFPTYRVLLACYLDVVSNWHEPDIVINFTQFQHENVLKSVYALLFETVLSQIFIHIRQLKTPAAINDETVWGLSELSACVILNRLYPAFQNSRLTGYPQLDNQITAFEHHTIDTPTLPDFLSKTVTFPLKL